MKKIFIIALTATIFSLAGCSKHDYEVIPETMIESLGTPSNREIWFVTNDDKKPISLNESAFDAEIEAIEISEHGVSYIRFADMVTSIGDDAFYKCYNLLNISLPHSIKTIGDRAFFECANIECITLGLGLRSCGSQAFDNCIGLYSLHIPSIDNWLLIEFEDKTSNPACYSQALICGGEKVDKLDIPSGITDISNYAFVNNTHLSEVTVPATVKSIGKNAFEGCNSLSKVDVEDIAAWSSIDFFINQFPNPSFSNPLSANDSVKFYVNGELASAITIEGIESISEQAFIGCSNISSLQTDEALRTVGAEAFRGCANITSVELASGVTDIKGRAFMGCKRLSKVVCHAMTPPTLEDKYVFDDNNLNRKIYVPAKSLNAYKEHADWSRYADTIEAIE